MAITPTKGEPAGGHGGGGSGGDRPEGLWASLSRRHDPLTSLILTIPVFLTYHLGILLIDLRNGVDLVSGLTFRLLEQSVGAYIALTLGAAAALIGAGVFLRRGKSRFRPRELVPVVVESLVLAVLMLVLVGWATGKLLPNQSGGAPFGFVEKIVMACGAGFHEEVVFRVALFAGGALLLRRLTKLGDLKSVLLAGLLSSLVFSGVHYIGPMGDDFALASFTFRTIAGLYLAVVYRTRGFAVAVYTHTFYDLLIFFFV